MRVDDWEEVIEKYLTLKSLFIECEETDHDLNTNLQPLNEFRAALDHVFRLIKIEVSMQTNGESDELLNKFTSEYDKLRSHIRRAFFDVCDYLAINYRMKIINLLEMYSFECITAAIPEYYSEYRPTIEQISERITVYRLDKGSVPDDELMNNYYADTITLRDIFKKVLSYSSSLSDIHSREKREKKRANRPTWIGIVIGAIIGIAGVIFGLLKR